VDDHTVDKKMTQFGFSRKNGVWSVEVSLTLQESPAVNYVDTNFLQSAICWLYAHLMNNGTIIFKTHTLNFLFSVLVYLWCTNGFPLLALFALFSSLYFQVQ
jgi:hypothetical protein